MITPPVAQQLPVFAWILGIILIALVAAKATLLAANWLVTRAGADSNWSFLSRVFDQIELPLYLSIVATGLFVWLPTIDLPVVRNVAKPLVTTVVILAWSLTIVRFINAALDAREAARSRFAIAPIVKSLWVVVAGVAVLLSILAVWNVNLTPLLASAGFLGVLTIIIGVAARDTIGNFFAGIALYFDRTYALGDTVQLASGDRGVVTDISIRSTTLLTRDNINITVPNSEMANTRVINESTPISRRQIRIDVQVAYGSDLETVRTALLAAAEAAENIIDAPSPQVRFQGFGDSGITVQLWGHIDTPRKIHEGTDELVRLIEERFDDADVTIPFPQRRLSFLEEGDDLDFARETETLDPRGE